MQQPVAAENLALPPIDAWASDAEDEAVRESELAAVIGANLRRFRKQRGLSLEQFGRLSKVSRAMLGQIELNRSVPTITVLWKIARALDLPVAALLSREAMAGPRLLPSGKARFLSSPSGKLRSRALFPPDAGRKVEFYEAALDGLAAEEAEIRSQGAHQNLVVSQGRIEVVADRRTYPLAAGDAIFFAADLPHGYRNPDPDQARFFLVVTYA